MVNISADLALPRCGGIGHCSTSVAHSQFLLAFATCSIPLPARERASSHGTVFQNEQSEATVAFMLPSRLAADGLPQAIRDQTRPACLVAGPEPGPRLAVKILVEEQEVIAVRSEGGTWSCSPW